MKTQFSIISYFDPYGDMKSFKKKLSRKNYESKKPLHEILEIIKKYNGSSYYNAVDVAPFDNRIKSIHNFDTSYYCTSQAMAATFQDVPGY